MAPRVITFAWILLRKALPTGKKQVGTLNILGKIALDAVILRMNCTYCFYAPFPKRLGSIIFGLSKLN
jgi:hypothetical protein